MEYNLYGEPIRSKKRTISMAEKKWMWKLKKKHICQICHRRVNDFFDAEFDHKRAHTKGGATSPANTLVVHKLCNRLKGKKSLSKIKKHLGTHKPKKRIVKKKAKKKRRNDNIFGLGDLNW
jgi:hypothetical protein